MVFSQTVDTYVTYLLIYKLLLHYNNNLSYLEELTPYV